MVFEKARGWRAYADVRRHLARAVRPRPRPPGLLQGRARDRAAPLARQARLRPRAGARPQLARSPRTASRRTRRSTCRTSTSSSCDCPRRPRRAGHLGPRARGRSEREAQRRFFAAVGRPVVALAIGTSDPEREWPAAALGGALRRARRAVRPAAGAGGRRLAARARDGARASSRAARHRPALDPGRRRSATSSGCSTGSALVVALDSAPLHLAVALDRPVIALCGAWNPKRTGPYRFRDLLVDAYGDPGEDYPVSARAATGPDGRASRSPTSSSASSAGAPATAPPPAAA